ncbi:MAG: ornithine decarboxylase, partial [Pararhodobacter sp.]|nr:ornithine decarboxylase [Pararhodobacter sp.]
MSDYYSAVQLRTDRWSALRDKLSEIERTPNGRRAGPLRAEVGKLFESLAVVERYWAFPGMAAFDHIRRQFEHGNIADVSFSVRRVTRALVSGAYRRRHIPLERDSSDADEHEDEA